MIKNKLFMLLIPLLLCGTGLFAQNAAVRGIVTGSPDGKPIAGASVVVKGSVRGTTTDASGAYTVAAGTGDVLVISFLGYKPQEVPVAGRTAVDVELQEDAELVEEVIVIGYGTMKKSDLTGSVASVKASDVTQVSAGSIDKLLQGRVAGLTVIDNSNDSPEGSVTMRVRGISSINGSNSPLVVVDGVPMGDAGNLTSVNPNIIESVEVLKDASATAIYGSRGANGVIMITTKNGQKDHRNVWFSGKVGVGVFSDRLDYWRDPVQMARLENEAYENGGAEGPYTGKIWSDGTYYPSIAEIESGAWPFRTKWADHVFRTSVTQDYSVGIEGSGEKNRYYVSLGYYDGEGMQYKDDFEKYTVDMSYDHQVARNINLKTKAGFVRGFQMPALSTSTRPVSAIRRQVSKVCSSVSALHGPEIMSGRFALMSNGFISLFFSRCFSFALPEPGRNGKAPLRREAIPTGGFRSVPARTPTPGPPLSESPAGYFNIFLIRLARCIIVRSPSVSSRSSMRRKICNWWICSRSTSSTLYLFCMKIGTQVSGELLARRTVLSKPPPARSKICSSSRSFSSTVSASANDVMCDIWLT